MNRSLIQWLIVVYLTFFGALSSGISLHAQERGDVDLINAALDRYATICNRCLDLKQLAAVGKEVPLDEFQALLQELSALKTTLQGGSGKMTESQRIRFLTIRDSYADGRKYQAPDTDSLTVISGDVSAAIAAGHKYQNPEKKEPFKLDNALVASDSIAKQQAISSSDTKIQTSPANITQQRAQSQQTTVPSLSDFGASLTILASVSVWPDLSYGLMGIVDKGRWGAFLKGSSNFKYRHPDYACQASDGTTPYGHIWTTGNTDCVLTSVTAGGVFNIFDNLSIYAGAGYGNIKIFWEDTSGKWALVYDLSGPCVASDGGILLHFGPVSAGIGIATYGINYANMEFSIGWRF